MGRRLESSGLLQERVDVAGFAVSTIPTILNKALKTMQMQAKLIAQVFFSSCTTADVLIGASCWEQFWTC